MLFGQSLKKYYKKYAWLLIIAVITLIAIDWVQLYIPDLLGELVGTLTIDYVASDVMPKIIDISVKVLGIAGIIVLGRIIWRLTLFRASTGIEAGLRKEMFEKAERLSVDFYRTNKVGTIISWISTDTEEVQEFFGWGTVMLVDGIFLTILVLVKMFMIDWLITLIIMIPIILIVVWGILVEKFMVIKWRNRQKVSDRLYDYSQESFAGIRVIKSFVKETQQLHTFAKIARKVEGEEVNFVRLSVIFDVLIEIIIALVMSLLLGIGGWLVYSTVTGNPIALLGHEVILTADKLVVFITYFTSLVWPLIALGQVITMRSRAKGSLDRIESFLFRNETVQNCENPYVFDIVKGKIEFKDLTFVYIGKKLPIVKNVSFVVNPGEMIGIVGRVGSGKSSIVNSLSRLFNVPEGTVYVDDVDIMKAEFHSLRKNIAYVTQDNFLFEDTIENNIKFANQDLSIEEVEHAAMFSDVAKDIEEFPEQYQTMTGERGVTLSGGQKQRIAMSRAFIKDAPIMVLDDSVSAVDVKTEETILSNIRKYRKGKTTLVVASRISTVSKLDKILVMSEGRVEAFDTPENLEKTCKTYQRMVYLQKLEQEIKEGNK